MLFSTLVVYNNFGYTIYKASKFWDIWYAQQNADHKMFRLAYFEAASAVSAHFSLKSIFCKNETWNLIKTKTWVACQTLKWVCTQKL